MTDTTPDHPDSHSFPTRPSSDLHVPAEGGNGGHGSPALVAGMSRGAPEPLRFVDDQQDRKSTRLNFSHSQTSYSVVCLKKKISPITRLCRCYQFRPRITQLRLLH